MCIDAGIWEHLDEKERAAIDRTRCWLTAAIDCATRCILSIYLTTEAPSGRSALEGLRWIMMDKEPLRKAANAQTKWPCRGTPENLFTDKGPGFKSDEFLTAAYSLGVGNLKPNAGLAQFRGKIERLFRSLDQGLVSRFEGRTFSNIKDKGDYDPEKSAAITCEELNHALIRYVCDVYHLDRHNGLGRSPAQEWNRLTELLGAEPWPKHHEMREVFGLPMDRTVGKKGIRLLGTFYQSQDLIDVWKRKQGTELKVRVDDRDVTEISVEITPGVWKTARAVGSSGEPVTIERLASSYADLFAQGHLAFDIDDPMEVQTRMSEALRDIESLARRSAERAGLMDAKALEKQLAWVRGETESAFQAWMDRRKAGNAGSADLVAGPPDASSSEREPSNDPSTVSDAITTPQDDGPARTADLGEVVDPSLDETELFWRE